MATKHFWNRKKRWPLTIRYDDKMVFVEIFNREDRNIVIKVLDEMCKNCEEIVLSQFVDSEIWSREKVSLLTKEIIQEQSTEVTYTNEFGGVEIDTISTNLVINLAGKLNYGLLQKTIHFGMHNPSNIVFGLGKKITDWKKKIPQWNQLVMKWFNLEVQDGDEQFFELVDSTEFIALTIDGNLFFCLTRIASLNSLFRIISQLSAQSEYKLEIALLHINGRK
jgi:hypothetical protein